MSLMDREVKMAMSNPTVHSVTVYRIYVNGGKDRTDAVYGSISNAVRAATHNLKKNKEDSVRIDSVKAVRRSGNEWGFKPSTVKHQGVVRNSVAKVRTFSGTLVNTFYTDPKGKFYAVTGAGDLGRRMD